MLTRFFTTIVWGTVAAILGAYIGYGTRPVVQKIRDQVSSLSTRIHSACESKDLDDARRRLDETVASTRDLTASRDGLSKSIESLRSRRELLSTRLSAARRRLADALLSSDAGGAETPALEQVQRLTKQVAQLDTAFSEGRRTLAAVDQQIVAAAGKGDDEFTALAARQVMVDARTALARGDKLLVSDFAGEGE